jgi:hypothetical protein
LKTKGGRKINCVTFHEPSPIHSLYIIHITHPLQWELGENATILVKTNPSPLIQIPAMVGGSPPPCYNLPPRLNDNRPFVYTLQDHSTKHKAQSPVLRFHILYRTTGC